MSYQALAAVIKRAGETTTIELAKVVRAAPLQIVCERDGFTIDRADLVLTDKVAQTTLKAGDYVILAADMRHKYFFLIDKAVL